MALTKKKQAFAEVFFRIRNAKKSALEAGYSQSFSEKKAYKLIEDNDVKSYMQKLEETYLNEKIGKLVLDSLDKLSDVLHDDLNRPAQLGAIKLTLTMANIVDKYGQKREKEMQNDTEFVLEAIIPDEYSEFGIKQD